MSRNNHSMQQARFIVIFALLFGLATGVAEAQTRNNPSVKQILERFIKAHGGKEALEKLKTRVMRCKLDMPAWNATMDFKIQSKAPDKRLTVLEVPGMATIREGYDGESGWSQLPNGMVVEKEGEELTKMERDCQFPRELALDRLYEDMTYRGTEQVGRKLTHVVEMKPKAGGKPERWYFDNASGLLLRTDQESPTPEGLAMTKVLYEDYRKVDGLSIPFIVRLTEPESIRFTLRVQEVNQNVPLPDALFAKPQ